MMRRATPPQQRQGVDVAGRSEATGLARRLVRDPYCGVHVAEVLAIPLRDAKRIQILARGNARDERRHSGLGDRGHAIGSFPLLFYAMPFDLRSIG